MIPQLLHSLCLGNTFFPVEILPNRLKGNFPFFCISHTTHSKNRSAIAQLAKADLRNPPHCLQSFFPSPAAPSSPPSLQQKGLWIRPKSFAPDRERKLPFGYTPGADPLYGCGTPGPQPRGGAGAGLSAGGRTGLALSTVSDCSFRVELVRDKYVHRKSSA